MLGPVGTHRVQWGHTALFLEVWSEGSGDGDEEPHAPLQALRLLPSCCWNPVCREQGWQLELWVGSAGLTALFSAFRVVRSSPWPSAPSVGFFPTVPACVVGLSWHLVQS